jgi:hypothetical protein
VVAGADVDQLLETPAVAHLRDHLETNGKLFTLFTLTDCLSYVSQLVVRDRVQVALLDLSLD